MMANVFSFVRSSMSILKRFKEGAAHELYAASPQGNFAAMFFAPGDVSDKPGSELERNLRRMALAIEKEQSGYHPIYGFTGEFPAKRRDLLDRNCTHVARQLENIPSKHQVRILDVGCNCGYVAFVLAEKFPNVVGVEIAKDRVEICETIAAHTKSSARFFKRDFIELMARGDDDLENVDVVLLLNVVHQFIFAHGLSYTKALLARLAARVDMVFVELARREQYERHGKDHLLPEDPRDVLSECENVEIMLLEDKPRPLYLLRRKRARFAHLEIEPQKIDFCLNKDPLSSRKYYTGTDRFLKLFRLTEREEISMFRREVDALLRMRGTGCAPTIYDWVATPVFGAVLMSKVSGPRLVQLVYRGQYQNIEARYEFTRQYLRLADLVSRRIGFHNDMQPHNIVVPESGDFLLIDYEQAGPEATNDPFGMLLWSLYDIWGGKTPERPQAIKSLSILGKGRTRAAGAVYPDFSGLALDATIATLVSEARTSKSWREFVASWNERLSRMGSEPGMASAASV